jgi:hypothetical protein
MQLMMEYKKYIVALIVGSAVFHVDQLHSQTANREQTREDEKRELAAGITAYELKEHLEILASDDYEGRETGMPGQKKAAAYLADYYHSLGIAPVVNGSWFQQYPLKRTSYLKSTANNGVRRFKMIEDFYAFAAEPGDLEVNDFVFVGYGIKEGKYNDYKNVDVKNKAVMFMDSEPISSRGISRISGVEGFSEWTMDFSKKEELAKSMGATMIVVVNMNYDEYIGRVRYWLEQAPMRLDNPKRPDDEEGLPVVFISPKMANELFTASGKTIEKLQKQIGRKGKPKSFQAKLDLVFHMERDEAKLTAENVLCYIEGSDPVLKNDVVVVSAHYDHIGIVKGQINNGADDDGSGTVSAMEIAEAFIDAKKKGLGSRRSILVLNVSGEEKGLLGSEWYSDFPVFPLENTVCNLNIDMIGRKDDQHNDGQYVYLIGSDKLSTELHALSEKCNATYTKLALDYTYNDPADPNRFYYRSDHYNFAKHNIPVIFYFSGVHSDYHKPGDDVEKIMFDKMETIARLVFYTAWEVANRDGRLKVDVSNDFEQD